MACGRCGASLVAGARYCGDCGAALAACPACGEPTVPGKRFCMACGQALSDVAPASAGGSASTSAASEVGGLGSEAGRAGLGGRAGVVTGEVAVTLGAVGEGMVAGDAVNTAARVQSAAEPGSVLVDGATQRLAGSAIGFAEAGEHALKG